MLVFQNPGAPTPTGDGAFVEIVRSLEWIDVTAIAILLAFFVLGLFRGLVWQLSRIATLALAYIAAGVFGTSLASVTSSWFAPDVAPELPLYVAYFLIFLTVLVLVSVVAHLLQRWVQASGFSFANRVGGGVLGVATGGLIVLAALTLVHMLYAGYGVGGSIVEAAGRSHSIGVSHEVLRIASDVLPESWGEVSDEWRELLGDRTAPSGQTPPSGGEGR